MTEKVVLCLSLGGIVAALRRQDRDVWNALQTALFCLDRPGLFIPLEPDSSNRCISCTVNGLKEFESGPRELRVGVLNLLVVQLSIAWEQGRLYFPDTGRLDYSQLDRFLAGHGLRPTELTGDYNYPDAINFVLRENPGVVVIDHDGQQVR